MRSQSYMDRAMRSSDPRFAKVLGKLGYSGTAKPVKKVVASDPLDALRGEAVMLGVIVDGRWGEGRLRSEIASAKKGASKLSVGETAESGRYKRRDMQAEE